MKITNISKGPKSIWSALEKSMVYIPAGATVEAEVDDAEREAANPEWFSFEEGESAAEPVKPKPENEHVVSDVTENEPDANTSPRPRGRPRKDA